MKPVLFATELSDQHKSVIEASGIIYEEVHPISTKPVFDPKVIIALLKQHDHLVVTSSASLHALALTPDAERSQKKIFVVGHSTAEKILALGFPTVHHASNALDLARDIPWNEMHTYLYLCGNRRQPTLPEFWKKNRISFQEVIVYETVLQFPAIEPEKYSTLVFFSPSGAQSLCMRNHIPPDMHIAALGPTTAQALEAYGFHQVRECPSPDFPSLIRFLKETP